MPARTQTKSSKIEKLQESKLNKNKLIAKILLNLRHNFSPLKIPISKIFSKIIFIFDIGPLLYLQDLKKIHWPLKIDYLKDDQKFDINCKL